MSSMISKNIMVVEDEWIVADQLCRSLKDLGYMRLDEVLQQRA